MNLEALAKVLNSAKGLSISIVLAGALIYFGSMGFDYLEKESDRMGKLTTEISQMRTSMDQHFNNLEGLNRELVALSRTVCLAHANDSIELRFACSNPTLTASD